MKTKKSTLTKGALLIMKNRKIKVRPRKLFGWGSFLFLILSFLKYIVYITQQSRLEEWQAFGLLVIPFIALVIYSLGEACETPKIKDYEFGIVVNWKGRFKRTIRMDYEWKLPFDEVRTFSKSYVQNNLKFPLVGTEDLGYLQVSLSGRIDSSEIEFLMNFSRDYQLAGFLFNKLAMAAESFRIRSDSVLPHRGREEFCQYLIEELRNELRQQRIPLTVDRLLLDSVTLA